MAVRNDFTAGEVLAAADLNDTFASKLPYSFGTATPSTTDSGFLWYDSNSTPAAPKFWDGSAFQALTSGKILQIVRATDSTLRSTTSSTFVDVTNVSVSITPQKNDSAIILALFGFVAIEWTSDTVFQTGRFRITDNSANPISGAENTFYGLIRGTSGDVRNWYSNLSLIAYATPATTSAITFKAQFARGSTAATTTAVSLIGSDSTTQFYAIEVSA